MNITAYPFLTTTSALWLIATATAAYLLGPLWDALATNRLGSTFERSVRLGFHRASLLVLMKLWTVALLSVFAASLFLLRSIPICIVLCWMTYELPVVLVKAWIARREQLLRDQLVVATVGLANSARAGLSLNDSIAAVAPDTPNPLQAELRGILEKYECGIDLGTAIAQVTERIQLECFSLLAAALKTTHEGGGNLAEAMVRISKSLQEHQRLERKMESVTANTRRSANMMAAFPVVFSGIMYLTAPDETSLLFTTLLGQVVLSAVIGLIYIGKRWMDRVTVVRA